MIDWSQTDLKTGEEAADWIKNTFASSIGKMNDDDQKTFLDFFNPSEDMDLSQYLALSKKVNTIFEAQDIEVPLDFYINDAKDVQSTLNEQKVTFEKNSKGDGQKLDDYFKQHSINTKEEIENWSKKQKVQKLLLKPLECPKRTLLKQVNHLLFHSLTLGTN